MTYEESIMHYQKDLTIQEMNLSGIRGLKGFYVDNCIAIDKGLTETEKSCVLAEELGHHFTSSGKILELNDIGSRKQELTARLWAYDDKIGLSGIIRAYKAGCRNRFEMAECLDVTEEFLEDALECYHSKYGICTRIDHYIIYFEPALGVMRTL